MTRSDRPGENAAVLAAWNVSRETLARFELFVSELRRWQPVKNLVGPGTLDQVWTRHIADSLQLADLEPDAKTWLDLGSGAGFPGLVLGIWSVGRPGAEIHLVESNSRKCAFLRHVARLTDAPVKVHDARIEAMIDAFIGRIEVVTARALAPLPDLLRWTAPLLRTGTTGLFPKGQEVEAELTQALKSWTFQPDILESRTDSRGRIIRIRSLRDTQDR